MVSKGCKAHLRECNIVVGTVDALLLLLLLDGSVLCHSKTLIIDAYSSNKLLETKLQIQIRSFHSLTSKN